MKKYIQLGKLQFLEDCAKGMSLTQFEKQYSKIEKYGLDVKKTFVILGGKIESKKVFKKKESKD